LDALDYPQRLEHKEELTIRQVSEQLKEGKHSEHVKGKVAFQVQHYKLGKTSLSG